LAHTRAISAVKGAAKARFFLARCLPSPRLAGGWLSFLNDFARMHRLGPVPDDLPPKPLRNYACRGLPRAERVRLLCAHYRTMAAILPRGMLAHLWQGQELVLDELAGKRGRYRLVLSRALTCRMEGELTIALQDELDRLILAKITFLMAPVAGWDAVLIGGLQGSPPGSDKRRIVAATRDLSGLRPKAAVFLGVQAFAFATGCTQIHAVSNALHTIGEKGRRYRLAKMHADYDAFWRERGGVPCPAFGFRLPLLDRCLLSAEAATAGCAKARHRAALARATVRALSGANESGEELGCSRVPVSSRDREYPMSGTRPGTMAGEHVTTSFGDSFTPGSSA
jgi:uncharacterized protein VirK/YbjX